jgi:hypothetical protein
VPSAVNAAQHRWGRPTLPRQGGIRQVFPTSQTTPLLPRYLLTRPPPPHHPPPTQEVSTMMRYGANPIIILINNGGYTIEVGHACL